MSKSVKSIQLIFENLDYVKIPAHYFSSFDLTDCSGSYAVAFSLKPETNTDFSTFEADVHSIRYESETLFDRLQRNDITHIDLHRGNGVKEHLSVVWEDADLREYRNRLQRTSMDHDGTISVRIGIE